MNYSRIGIWLIVTVTPFIAAMIARFIWEAVVNPYPDKIAYVALLVLALLSAYVLFLYLTIKPGRKKLQRLPVLVWIVVIVTAGIVGGFVHFIRFIPSPEGDPLLSKILAGLILLGSASAYFLFIRLLWSFWRARER